MSKKVPLPVCRKEPEPPEKGTAYYVLLDCPCGCGYTECHIFLFAAPCSPALAAFRAMGTLGLVGPIVADAMQPIESTRTFLGLGDTYRKLDVHADNAKTSYAFNLLGWLRYEHERKGSK